MSNEIVVADDSLVPEKIEVKPIDEVAKLASEDENIASQLSAYTVDNLKAFKLAYARSQLERVVKLTNSLESLEDKLIEDAMANPDKYDITRVIGTIQRSLDSALGIVGEVTGESYMNIVYNDNSVTTNTTEFNSVKQQLNVSDQDSRERIRLVASQVLSRIKSATDHTNKPE